MEIKNEQVKSIYKRWEYIFSNSELKMEKRMKAFTVMKTIEALVAIYEEHRELDEENMDDLFIAWGRGVWPLLPEQREEFLKRIKSHRRENK